MYQAQFGQKRAYIKYKSPHESRRSLVNNFRSNHNADSALRLSSSPGLSGGEQRRCGGRRAAVLGRLFVTVANLDQQLLRPRSAEEFDADRDAERGRRSW